MRVSLEKTEVTDMRKITVTEDNFEKVLEKLRKMCDKYKMLEFYRALSEDLTEVKCKTNSMGLRSELDKEWRDKNGEYKYKVKKKFFMYSKYVCVTKHPFRRDYETDKESYNAKYMYPKMKSLIHLDLSASCALLVKEIRCSFFLLVVSLYGQMMIIRDLIIHLRYISTFIFQIL